MKKKISSIICIVLTLLAVLPTQTETTRAQDSTEEFYGYLLEINPKQTYSMQTNISILVNKLLQNNLSVYILKKDTEIKTQKISIKNEIENLDKNFNRGSYVVPFQDNLKTNKKIVLNTILYSISLNINSYKIKETLENIEVIRLNKPKIAIYETEGIDSRSYEHILNKGGFLNLENIGPEKLIKGFNAENFNLIAMGGKYGDFTDIFYESASSQGRKVSKKIREFVENGGAFIGSCYGAYRSALGMKRPIGYPLFIANSMLLNLIPTQIKIIDSYVYRALPGRGQISIKITDKENPMTYGLPEILTNHTYGAGPVFLEKNFLKSNTKTIANIKSINRNIWNWDAEMELCPWWNNGFSSDDAKNKKAERQKNPPFEKRQLIVISC